MAVQLNNGREYQIPGNEGHPSMYMTGVIATVASACVITAACMTTFPLAGPISLVALGILTATSYGIINDFFACRQCIHYFTNGHTAFHKRLLQTENPNLNAVVWGIHATWKLGAVAGVLFAVSAIATGLAVMPILPYLAAAKLAGSFVACLYSHYKSKAQEAYWSRPENADRLNSYFEGRYIAPINDDYHLVDLSKVPLEKRAAWMAVGARNNAGYTVMPALGVVMLITIIFLGIFL